MIDRNKLNRIQGVLSARLGAEIPKFLTPAGPITKYDHNDPDFVNFINLTKARHNPITWERYLKLKLLNPSASIDLLALDYNAGKDIQSSSDIVGAKDLTPDTAKIESAKQLEQNEAAVSLLVADINAAKSKEVLKAFDPTTPMSPNDGPSLYIPEPAARPEKLTLPEQTALELEALKSAGMKLAQEKIEKQARAENFNKVAGNAAQIGTLVFQGIGDAFGASLAATDSKLTKTADAAYDKIAEGVKNMGPIGLVVGTAMQFAGTAGDIIQGMGGGTDQMTGTDKWMDSSFFSWNIGMLNGFGGKRSDAFAADQDILASVGSSYGGTTEDINNAASKASKKYGLFSSGARRKANRQIADARSKLNLMGDISEEATDLRLAVQSMGELAGLAYSLMTDGGYSLKYTYAAKHGGLLEWNPEIELTWEPQIELNWELPEFKEGGSIDLVEELEWIPEFKEGGDIDTAATMSDWWKGTWSYLSGNKDSGLLESLYKPSKSNDPNVKYYYREGLNNDVVKNILGGSEYGKKDLFGEDLFYKDFNDVWNRLNNLGGRAERNTDNSHLGAYTIGIGEDSKGRYISYYDKFDWAPDGVKELFHPYEIYNRIYEDEFNKTQESLNGIDYKGSNPSGNWFFKSGKELYNYIKNHKEGGSIKESNIPEIEETTQKNVIPEGALHKNKHHMEHAEGLTKKGIPVIDEDGELQAEIEHSEIIFTLEVTKKLEEYYDIFYSEESSNKEKEQAALDAGKLLVYQILENTEDRTGLIESCKKGGSLKLKNSTDDLIEEVLEWMPTIVVIEEEIKEEKPKEDKKKSEKELMKEAIKEVLIELLTK